LEDKDEKRRERNALRGKEPINRFQVAFLLLSLGLEAAAYDPSASLRKDWGLAY
jgi:hypothetical protein